MKERIYLLPSRAKADAYKKDVLSLDPAQSLGAVVTTPADWLQELWELWGDVRSIVDSQTLTYICFRTLAKQDSLIGDSLLPVTRGTASSIALFYRDVAGPFDFSSVSHELIQQVAPAEGSVLKLGRFVEEELKNHGLCLPGAACRVLLESVAFSDVSLIGDAELPPYLSWFLDSIGVNAEAPSDALVGPLPEGVRPAFLFPSGPNATGRVISDYCLGFAESLDGDNSAPLPSHQLVVCTDPLYAYSSLSPHLNGSGARVEVVSRVPVVATSWGMLCNVVSSVLSGRLSSSQVSALVSSPYSGLSSFEGQTVEARFRRDRSLAFGGGLSFLEEHVPSFAQLSRLVGSRFSDEALAWAHTLTKEVHASDPFMLSLETAALDSLALSFRRAEGLVSDASVVLEFALGAFLSLAFHEGPDDARTVIRLSDPNAASQMPSSSYDVVVLAESDSVSYAAVSSHAALDRLSGKLGIVQLREPSRRLRSWFTGLIALAKKEFCCCFCPSASGGEERYPAFFVEELASHYQQGESWQDNPLGIGRGSGAKALIQGEDDIVRNVLSGNGAKPECSKVSLSHVLRRPQGLMDKDGSFVLSASALETYLSCPRKWFLNRKLSPDHLDERLGSLERGSFVHEVWQRFYAALGGADERVTPENLAESKVLLGGVFDEVLEEQSERGLGRYLPLSDFELRDADSLKVSLLGNLDVHAQLLPGFVPRWQELALAPEDGIEFAGALIRGSVDRVDIDETTKRLAVVDYKGSVSGHAAGFDPDAVDKKTNELRYFNPDGSLKLPAKIQSLVYAQALRQVPELADYSPGAALYLSYRAQEPRSSVAGSCSQVVPAGVPLTDSSIVQGDFLRYLDLVEEALVPYVERMKAGMVEPDPKGNDVCSYCPDLDCPRRLK